MKNDAITESYERHAEYEAYLKLASCYTMPDSVDAWRHESMIDTFSPLINQFKDAKFMTIGDGRYGADAFLLKKRNVDVLATSLTDNYLKIAKEKGYIDNYEQVNCENIQKPDNSYDFIVCKESYHHFPRPSIAFYEMLRVSKKGVILIEPTDDRFCLFDYFKRPLKKFLRKNEDFDYEESGNYIYRVNSKEIKKMLKAINKPLYAIKYFNDFYMERFSDHKSNWKSAGYIITRLAIILQDILCFFRLMNYGKATIIIFKEDISVDCKRALKKAGFKLSVLPRNPYLQFS